MSISGPVTVELLTREVAFAQPETMAEELNKYLEHSRKFDEEFSSAWSSLPEVNEEDTQVLQKLLEKHTQRAASMEYHALVRVPKSSEAIPNASEAILVRNNLLKIFELLKDVILHIKKINDTSRHPSINAYIQRWIYKFCRYVFDENDLQNALILLFEKEQTKGKDGFSDMVETIAYLGSLITPGTSGADSQNFRRLYVIFSNLLAAYLKGEITIPLNLQKIFIEFHKYPFFNYTELEGESLPIQMERKALLMDLNESKKFFSLFREIASPMKKSVFLGMLVGPERKKVMEEFAETNLKGVADVYSFIGKTLGAGTITEASGRDWMINVYDTVTEVMANHAVPDDMKEVFSAPQSFPAPAFRKPPPEKPKKVVIALEGLQQIQKQMGASAPKKGPELIEIPNLVKSQSLEELKQEEGKQIVMVQDADVLDNIVKNWGIRGSLTFPEVIEFIRIPLQIQIPPSPGMRAGRRFISFAYFIAMGLDEELASKFLDKLPATNQISDNRIQELTRIYPIAFEQLESLKELTRDARRVANDYGQFNPTIFIERCTDLRSAFMEHFAYLESLICYWNLVEEVFYSICVSTSIMGNIKDAKSKDIEGFVTQRNDEYFKAYEKALLFPEYRVLKNYIRKKYTSELQTHFVNVKIKNDLLTIAKTKPVNLAER